MGHYGVGGVVGRLQFEAASPLADATLDFLHHGAFAEGGIQKTKVSIEIGVLRGEPAAIRIDFTNLFGIRKATVAADVTEDVDPADAQRTALSDESALVGRILPAMVPNGVGMDIKNSHDGLDGDVPGLGDDVDKKWDSRARGRAYSNRKVTFFRNGAGWTCARPNCTDALLA